MTTKFYVEGRVRGSADVWKPIPGLFGVGRWEVPDAKSAEAEIRLWTRSRYGSSYEFRVRSVEPPKVKTEEKRQAEVAKQERDSKSIGKMIAKARKGE